VVLATALVFVVLEAGLLVVIYRRCFSDSDVMHATDLFYFSFNSNIMSVLLNELIGSPDERWTSSM
jgi:hypothetical protein